MKTVSVEDEYKKNKNIRPEDVKSLQEWVEKQPHLPKITELETIFFLNCYCGSIEQAKGLIEIYYTSRTHCPEFFEKRNPEALKKDMDVVLYSPLKNANAFYLVYLDTNPTNSNLNHQIKLMCMMFDIWLLQKGCVDGYEFIIDMKGVQFGHLAKLNVSSLKKALYILQEALPLQITRIHVINVISIADKFLNLFKPFIKVDLLDKIIFHHNGIESLTKYISETSIPQNLGGQGPTLQEMHDEMKQMLNENSKYFTEEEITKRVDETKRPGKPKTASELFGIEGSFRKLDID